MRKPEMRSRESRAHRALALLLGGLLALGVELVVLLLGAAVVSAGILRDDTTTQITAAACLIGCFVGGYFVCSKWTNQRLLAGVLTGAICIVLIFLLALVSGEAEFGTQMLVEVASCFIGGGLSGLLAGRKKKRKYKAR